MQVRFEVVGVNSAKSLSDSIEESKQSPSKIDLFLNLNDDELLLVFAEVISKLGLEPARDLNEARLRVLDQLTDQVIDMDTFVKLA